MLLRICPDFKSKQHSTCLLQIQLVRQRRLPPPMVAKSQWRRPGLLWRLEAGRCAVLRHQVRWWPYLRLPPSRPVELVQPLLHFVNHSSWPRNLWRRSCAIALKGINCLTDWRQVYKVYKTP